MWNRQVKREYMHLSLTFTYFISKRLPTYGTPHVGYLWQCSLADNTMYYQILNFSFDNSIDVFHFISYLWARVNIFWKSLAFLFFSYSLNIYWPCTCYALCGTENLNQIHTICDSWNRLSTRGDSHETINYRNNYLSTVVAVRVWCSEMCNGVHLSWSRRIRGNFWEN